MHKDNDNDILKILLAYVLIVTVAYNPAQEIHDC